jgi:hypothetical protein
VRSTSLNETEQFEDLRRIGTRWEASDGSKIIVEEAKSAKSPVEQTPPWQLFRVTLHEGNGRLSGVSWIQRLNTDKHGQSTYVFYGAVD